jgi:hypothetical protein
MKRFTLIAMLLASFSLHADPAPVTAPVPEAGRTQQIQYLKDALRDGDITQQQYDDILAWIASKPCQEIDSTLAADRQKTLAEAVAKQLKVSEVKIEASFFSEGWSVLWVSNSSWENQYLFYSGDPTTTGAVTTFGGSAPFWAAGDIEHTILEEAPGIPRGLAACFAWRITLGPPLHARVRQ